MFQYYFKIPHCCNNNYNIYNIIRLKYFDTHVAIMMTATPEHYLMMLANFRKGIDTTTDPSKAFKKGTPQWMIDEWVEFNSTAVIDIC